MIPSAKNYDVVIVGAGIIGCTLAYTLSREGMKVVVVEKNAIGREASWAAGGILNPIHLAQYPAPLIDLCVQSQKLYPAFIRSLRRDSSTDPEFTRSGSLILSRDAEDQQYLQTLVHLRKRYCLPHQILSPRDTLRKEPLLQPQEKIRRVLFLPDTYQVRNHRLTQAVAEAARHWDAVFLENTPVLGLRRSRQPRRMESIQTQAHGPIRGEHIVVTAGAWTSQLLATLPKNSLPPAFLSIKPIKGQMIALQGRSKQGRPFLRHIVIHKNRYIIPRRDGVLLVGSTLEDVGFHKRNTAQALARLSQFALTLVPALKEANFLTCWAGLRPKGKTEMPYVGKVPGYHNLWIAAGHHRNGILLAPITASLLSDLLLNRPTDIDSSPFQPIL